MRNFAIPLVTVVCSQLLLCGLARTSSGGTKIILGRAVPADEQVAMDQISHVAWSDLLARYVDKTGMVNYKAWKASPADVKRLDQYLNSLSAASTTAAASREARLAFWINAYNAVTIKGILREYPTSSIRNHTPRLFGYHIWHDLLLQVGGQSYSLTQIEHDVLRKMGDPRIHFAIVCASRGCPRLLDEAYTAATLDDQLDDNAKNFFARRANFQYDARARTIKLSYILELFGEDFGPNMAAQLKRIAPYLPDAASRKLAESGNASVSYLDYDWSLNDQATSPTARGQ
jgi:Protein of unknown function, DUF547